MQHTNSKGLDSDYPLTEPEKKIYNKWRLRVLFSIILGYGTYYTCRQNFSIIIPAYLSEFNYSKTELGWVLSAAAIVYGAGKFINGYFSDRTNARYFMPTGLLCSALITIALGYSSSILVLGMLWIANNWFQSMGWPPVAKMLTHWFAPRELGTKWALGAVSHQIGGALTLIFAGYLIHQFGWRYAFFVPGIIAGLIALFLFYFLRQSPKEVGLISVEEYKNDFSTKKTSENDKLTNTELFETVFLNRNMWYICIANMCVYAVRIGIVFWIPLFLSEVKNIALKNVGWQVAAYEVAGMFGGVIAGWMSDKIFGGNRGPVGILFMLGLAGMLVVFWLSPLGYDALYVGCLTIIGFFVYGPQILIGVASADFVDKKAIGTANGLTGTMGYVGSSIAGICVGYLVDTKGWIGAFAFFIVSALIGAFFFFLTWRASRTKTVLSN